MNSCEEYVLNELSKTKEELLLAKKEIEELKSASNEEIVVTEDDMKCLYLSDKPNYYYSVDCASEFNWNKILKSNKLTPKFVEEALVDDKKFKKLCSLSGDWYTIGKVNQNIYNYLLKTRNGLAGINLTSDDMYMVNFNRDGYYLKESDAIKYRDEKVKKSIKYYLENYKDKFEVEK